MGDATAQTVYFYDRHPISLDIICAKLQRAAGTLMVCGQMICFHLTRITMAAWRDRRIGERGSDRKRIASGRFLRRTPWHRSVSRLQIWRQSYGN